MVRWRTYYHSCPPHPEYHQQGVQLDRELGTTAQHNQDGQHTLHIVDHKGEGLTKIKQPASFTGWDANISWGNPRHTLDVETTPWSSWSQGHQKTGHHEETCRNHLEGGEGGGGNSDILKQVYTGAVRPVIKYASKTWDTASKTNKSKLDRVQNMGLRIILGAVRSTPIQQMEKTADLQFNLWSADMSTKLQSKGKSWRDWPVIHSTRNFSMEPKTAWKERASSTSWRTFIFTFSFI